MCNLDVRIREREGTCFFFRARLYGDGERAEDLRRRSNGVRIRRSVGGHCSCSYKVCFFYNGLCALVRAVSARRGRVPPQSPQVLPSVVEGVSSPLQFPTQHLQPSLGRDIEHRRRFRSRARAGRVDAPRRASVVGLTAGREKHRPRDVCFPTDARWREDVGVPRRERALQPTHRLLEVATHGVHELAAHDVASPRRLDAHRAESPLHRGAHAETPRRTVWGWNLNAFVRPARKW